MLVRATPGLSLENSSFAPSIIARLVAHCLPLASFIGSWMPSATAPAIVAATAKATRISNNVQPPLLLFARNRLFIGQGEKPRLSCGGRGSVSLVLHILFD